MKSYLSKKNLFVVSLIVLVILFGLVSTGRMYMTGLRSDILGICTTQIELTILKASKTSLEKQITDTNTLINTVETQLTDISISSTPTASLTANGTNNLTIATGKNVIYAWQTGNATKASATYTTNLSRCGTGGKFWQANTLGGASTAGTFSAGSAGCSYVVTYTATNSSGVEAKSVLNLNIVSPTTVAPSTPTASLTANGTNNLTIATGKNVIYAWQTGNATKASATYTTNLSRCGTGGKFWQANTLGGASTAGTFSAGSGGCSYVVTYTAIGSTGATVSSILKLNIVDGTEASPASLNIQLTTLNSTLTKLKSNLATLTSSITSVEANLCKTETTGTGTIQDTGSGNPCNGATEDRDPGEGYGTSDDCTPDEICGAARCVTPGSGACSHDSQCSFGQTCQAGNCLDAAGGGAGNSGACCMCFSSAEQSGCSLEKSCSDQLRDLKASGVCGEENTKLTVIPSDANESIGSTADFISREVASFCAGKPPEEQHVFTEQHGCKQEFSFCAELAESIVETYVADGNLLPKKIYVGNAACYEASLVNSFLNSTDNLLGISQANDIEFFLEANQDMGFEYMSNEYKTGCSAPIKVNVCPTGVTIVYPKCGGSCRYIEPGHTSKCDDGSGNVRKQTCEIKSRCLVDNAEGTANGCYPEPATNPACCPNGFWQ